MPSDLEKTLKKLVKPAKAEKYAPSLEGIFANKLPESITQIHFLTQIIFESGGFRRMVENMNYSAERLLKIFPKHFKTIEEARKYERQPLLIGNKVYANRNGNGPESSGDGYKYRGRGPIQVTFRNNYAAFQDYVGDDQILVKPALVVKKYPMESALWYWESRKLGRFALKLGSDVLEYKDSVSEITYRVNGSRRSVDERFKIFKKVFDAFEQPT